MNWLFSHTWVSFNKRQCCCGLVWNQMCTSKFSRWLQGVSDSACSLPLRSLFTRMTAYFSELCVKVAWIEDLQGAHWLPSTNHSVPLECWVSLHSPISQCTSPSSKGAPSNPMCLPHGTSHWGTADLDKDWDLGIFSWLTDNPRYWEQCLDRYWVLSMYLLHY